MFTSALKRWRHSWAPLAAGASADAGTAEEAPLRAALFSSDQMVAHGRQLAASHRLAARHAPDGLLARLSANERQLNATWRLLSSAAAAGRPVTPAAEWLLDNQYMIAEEIRNARHHLPKGYSRELPRLAAHDGGSASGSMPRVYDLALQAISHCDGRLSRGTLSRFVSAYQDEQALNIGELWAFPIMLRLALIENLRRVSVRIAADRTDQEAAAVWAARMAQAADDRPSDLILEIADMARSEPSISSAFVAEFTRRLQGQGAALALALTWIEQLLAEGGQTIEQLVQLESQHQATAQVSVANSIGSLRLLAGTDWREFVETLSSVEQMLHADPADTYGRMDFASRDAYRHAVERLARRSGKAETAVARQVLDMAGQAALRPASGDGHERQAHVGYYLLGGGRAALHDALGVRRRWPLREVLPLPAYQGLALAAGVALAAGPFSYSVQVLQPPPAAAIALALLMLLCTLHLALATLNWCVTLFVPPQALPRLDYAHGIPSESRTLVVVPTLLGSAAAVEAMADALELRYLANRDANLQFALLTDLHDASREVLPEDEALIARAVQRITGLNHKYRQVHGEPAHGNDLDPFLLLHRPRRWNAREGVWMGHERKRGKLADLNALLRGRASAGPGERFSVIVGDTRALAGVRYVITLDADTQLPRDSAAQMAAAMAHPLNRPRFGDGARSDVVVEGHGILQPRVGLNLPSTAQSGYARLFGGEPGIDPYTRTVSDVYQDLYDEGSFIGKGIYDVDAFERALKDRFPENRILSHDLIEGCHIRSGLLSDVELLEEAPPRYGVDAARRHRWMRGDWQLLGWLRARVHTLPGAPPNPLSRLSRWKLLDNLRRSLMPPALLALLLLAWLWLPDPGMWTLRVLAIVGLVPLAAQALEWLRTPILRWRTTPAAPRTPPLGRQLLQLLHGLACLPYEAMLNSDAIVRSLWRQNVSKRRLLEWTASADLAAAEQLDQRARLKATARLLWIGPLLAVMLTAVLAAWRPAALPSAAALLLLWLFSPLLVWWIDRPLQPAREALSAAQQRFLRQQARRTWGFFESFAGIDDHHLPPDNVQEQPVVRVAHRTSPSNIGFALLAALAAHELRWLTQAELAQRTQDTLATLERLERYRGHFFNWYDTRSLQPLRPRYLSSVDSGNLAAALLTLRAALSNLADEPLLAPDWAQGVQDTLELLRETAATLQWPLPAPLLSAETTARDTLATLQQAAAEALEAAPPGMLPRWLLSLQRQTAALRDEFALLGDAPDGAATPSLRQLAHAGNTAAQTRLAAMQQLCERLERLNAMDPGLLYDRGRHLLAIGYNLDEHRADEGHYDLLASEARLSVLVAIAMGQLPQRSWFALGRLLGTVDGAAVLMSWSGSMFEYLMPLLLAPQYPNTLLEQSCRVAVQRQIAYGKERGVPWGVSESGYNATDTALNYQYRAFGVPGLGLKRGLGEDLVVAPYASMLALLVEPVQACENLQRLADAGACGAYGLHEAVDYTRSRLPKGQSHAVVRSFMAHHQGMGLIALLHVLRGPRMQQHFASDPRIRASLLLLQERVPKENPPKAPEEHTAWRLPGSEPGTPVRSFSDPDTPAPEVQLLSNGSYHVMVTQAGGGYSHWKDLAVTRWHEDPTCDAMGSFCYVRDLDSGEFWSTALQPTRHAASRHQAVLSEGKVELLCSHEGIRTQLEISVSPEDQVELRRLHIRNTSRSARRIEVTSYAEVVLSAAAADAQHPAFSKLFVHTEILDDASALLCQRRARGPADASPWLFHLLAPHRPKGVSQLGPISYESDRAVFIGRNGTLASPAALRGDATLSGTAGAVLDPVAAGRCTLRIEPDRTAVVDFVTGVGDDRASCLTMIEKYRDRQLAERVFELAWTHSQVLLRQLNAGEGEAQLFARMAGAILYHDSALRADPALIAQNRRSQSGLWGYAISGDLPIVLLQIAEAAHIDLVRQLVVAHAWWRIKGLAVDLVIWNEERDTYRQHLHEQILGLIAAGIDAHVVDRPGGIFVRHADQIPHEDRMLLLSVARIVLSDRRGSLSEQLERRPAPQRRRSVRGIVPRGGHERRSAAFVPRRTPRSDAPGEAEAALPALRHFNGFGGFNADATEYVIAPDEGRPTPAPWANLVANPHFGSVLSEAGMGYTWFENAHEYRLTPWHNDPVSDPSGEQIYVRDEDSGRFWCATPQPARPDEPLRHRVRHGFGYSVFELSAPGLRSSLQVYAAPQAALKFMRLRLDNHSGRARRLSVTAYVEWVLGDMRSKTAPHIVTERSAVSGALLARNSFGSDFAEWVAFFDVDAPYHAKAGFTCDRNEFVGRHGSLHAPRAMARTGLTGRSGAALDPCAAWQLPLELAEGQSVELVFRLGAAHRQEDAERLIQQARGDTAAAQALQAVQHHWRHTLGAVQVDTPDAALDALANGWLLYQTIACRLWARSGFYQSGGAFGFRDQLQDTMALVHTRPELLREQLLLCASRQFVEGDVQHWWHPPTGRGVRTHISDDLLWLPLALCRYVRCSGDAAVLSESVAFLEGRALEAGAESYFDMPSISSQSATLYEHALRATRRALQFGPHGLPLMGGGDWNDGMNLVGHGGRGESVWLGFFLCEVLRELVPLARAHGDDDSAAALQASRSELMQRLEQSAWDGGWYRRAYFDDGSALGSAGNAQCRIDSIAQSWSVLSGVAPQERADQAMQALLTHLWHPEHKLLRLLAPPFDGQGPNPGYISGYLPGVRENGGQYTHAAIWAAMAFAQRREASRAWMLLDAINPMNHARDAAAAQVYRNEPYVMSADVYALAPHAGRAGWSWYTGSAGWMYQLIVETLLGLQREHREGQAWLRLRPLLPAHWPGFDIRYRFGNTCYRIRVQRDATLAHDSCSLDGAVLSRCEWPLHDDGQPHQAVLSLAAAD